MIVAIAYWLALNSIFVITELAADIVAVPSQSHGPTSLSTRSFKIYQPISAIKCRLLTPMDRDPDQRFPLVVFLHGSGQRGDDNRSQLRGFPEQMANSDWRLRYPCYMLVPQCPERFAWKSLIDELTSIIHEISSKNPIDTTRIYLTGLSMGGFGCFGLAAEEPQLFAAVVPICGGGDPTTASKLVDTPMWIVHGDADEVVPVEQSRKMVESIRAAGGTKVLYTELPGVGHNSWTQTYSDPDGPISWMFNQHR